MEKHLTCLVYVFRFQFIILTNLPNTQLDYIMWYAHTCVDNSVSEWVYLHTTLTHTNGWMSECMNVWVLVFMCVCMSVYACTMCLNSMYVHVCESTQKAWSQRLTLYLHMPHANIYEYVWTWAHACTHRGQGESSGPHPKMLIKFSRVHIIPSY